MRPALIAALAAKTPPETAREQDGIEAADECALEIAASMPAFDFEPLLVCARNSSLAKRAASESIPFLPVSPRPGLAALYRLWRWRKRRPDATILAIGNRSLGAAKLFRKMDKRGAIYVYFPIFEPDPEKSLSRLDGVLCGSGFIAEAAEKIIEGAKRESDRPPIIAAPPGMDISGYRYPAAPFDGAPPFVFGMAESLMPESGALLVARAMSALWQQNDVPGWEVRMFGSGPRFDEILEEAGHLGVLPRLSILGDQPLDEVARHCDVWIAPGASSRELPSTLWAGFAAGLPVIACESRLHRERLAPDSALIVDSENPQNLAAAMLALMRDKNLRAKMAETGMRSRISLTAMAERVCVILRGDGRV